MVPCRLMTTPCIIITLLYVHDRPRGWRVEPTLVMPDDETEHLSLSRLFLMRCIIPCFLVRYHELILLLVDTQAGYWVHKSLAAAKSTKEITFRQNAALFIPSFAILRARPAFAAQVSGLSLFCSNTGYRRPLQMVRFRDFSTEIRIVHRFWLFFAEA